VLLAGLTVAMAFFMANASAIVSGLAPGQPAPGHRLREGGDSFVHWFALQALRAGQDPYDLAVARATQIAIWGAPFADDPHVQALVYPLPTLLWYLPTLALNLELAAFYARLLAQFALGAAVLLTLRLVGLPAAGWTALAAITLLGSLAGPYDQHALGQNASLGLAMALASAILYRAGHPGMAGAALALGLVKPQYLVILGLGLGLHALTSRQWRFFVGGGLGVGVPGGLGLLVAPDWIAHWLANVSAHAGRYIAFLRVLVGDDPTVLWLVRALIVLPILAGWWRWRHARPAAPWFPFAVAISLAGGMLAFTANPGPYNLLLAWPALVVMLLAPEGAPANRVEAVLLALNVFVLVVTPVAAGLVVLAWLTAALPAGLLSQLAALVVWAGLLQGGTVVLWGLARVAPVLARAWPRAAA
jgi:hypothetical protein